MKSSIAKRPLAIPGHLHSLYHFLPTALQHSLLVLTVSILLFGIAIFG